MRTRTTSIGGFDNLTRIQKTRSCSATAPITTTNLNSYPGGYRSVKTVTDVEIPNFRALRRCQGWLPFNPCVIVTEEESITRTVGHWQSRPSACAAVPWTTRVDGSWTPTGYDYLTVPPPNETVMQYVVNSAVANMRSATLDALTTLAELKDVLRLYKHAIDVTDEIWSQFPRKGKQPRTWRGLRKEIARAGDHWLAYRYGWTPAVLALQDAIKAYNDLRRGIVEGRSQNIEDLTNSNTVVGSEDQGSRRASWQYDRTVLGSRTYRGYAVGGVNSYRGDFGFDPLVTAYELIPYSFVLDWFFQVGTWLEAVSPFAGGECYSSGVSIKTSYVSTRKFSLAQSNSVTHVVTSMAPQGSLYRYVVDRYERIPMSASLPGFNPRLTIPRITDALALAYGLLHRTVRFR